MKTVTKVNEELSLLKQIKKGLKRVVVAVKRLLQTIDKYIYMYNKNSTLTKTLTK